MNGFSFGDKSTWDFSMHVEKHPALKGPTRKRTTINVPGRNGALHIDEGSYTNYHQPYECYFHNDRPMPELAHSIREWLHSDGGYHRLTDTYDPQHFRRACFVGPLDVENHLNKYGRCIVYFDCAPQSFLLSGEHPVQFSSAGVIHNPTYQIALPIIKAYGTGAGSITVGGVTIEVNEIAGSLEFDCETENAYILLNGGREYKNTSISAPKYPTLQPGDNAVSISGDITHITIIPRWWET